METVSSRTKRLMYKLRDTMATHNRPAQVQARGSQGWKGELDTEYHPNQEATCNWYLSAKETQLSPTESHSSLSTTPQDRPTPRSSWPTQKTSVVTLWGFVSLCFCLIFLWFFVCFVFHFCGFVSILCVVGGGCFLVCVCFCLTEKEHKVGANEERRKKNEICWNPSSV